jgi:hypothetical protein
MINNDQLGYVFERKHSKQAVAHLSVTISNTAPNLLSCPKARAAIPSKTSRMQEIK